MTPEERAKQVLFGDPECSPCWGEDGNCLIHQDSLIAVIRQAENDAFDRAAGEALRVWRDATNERTDSAATSFMRNALAQGCIASADAIRALKHQ